MEIERKIGRSGGHFIVDVERLKQSPFALDCEIPLEWLASELAACEYPVRPRRGHIQLEALLADSGVLVRGEAKASVETECGTCLAEIGLELTAPLSAFLMPLPSGAQLAESEELTPEDLDREWYEGTTIVLDDIVRDGIVLELPMTPRCEGECRGEAVAHLSKPEKRIDPRLAPLAGISLSKEK